MTIKIRSNKVLLENELREATISVKEGCIADISDDRGTDVIDYGDAIIAPGFIDIHTHGGYGCEIMEADRLKIYQWFPKPEPDPKPDPEPDPEPDPKPEPDPDPKPEPDPKPDPEPDPDPTEYFTWGNHQIPIASKIPVNSYDKTLFQKNDKGYITYESDKYTSRIGIDVSRYQGEIDWKQVKDAGVEFAIIRLGYRGYGTGKIVTDTYFHKNIKGALAQGLVRQ